VGNTIMWNDVGPLAIGASTTLVVNFTAVASTMGAMHTNEVVATPTTPPMQPMVPPMTNGAPYQVEAMGYTLLKMMTSPTGGLATVNESLSFSITIANTGEVPLVTVPLSDTYDSTFILVTNAVPAPDVMVPGMVTWNDVGALPAGASTTVLVHALALTNTAGLMETNTAMTSPSVSTNYPPLPPMTSDAPYEVVDPPTVVLITDVRGYVTDEGGVFEWTTASEVGTVGFNVYRVAGNSRKQINPGFVPSSGLAQGGVYRLADGGIRAGGIYSYVIEEIESRGLRSYGPYSVYVAPDGGPTEAIRNTKTVRSKERSREAKNQPSLTGSGNILRISVLETGIYFLSADQLAARFDLPRWYVERMIRLGELELSNRGRRITFMNAEDDGGLYFHGEALDDIYEDENVYWLGWGRNPGLRVESGRGPGAVLGSRHQHRVHAEQDKFARPSLARSAEEDYWTWTSVLGSTNVAFGRDFSIDIDQLDPAGTQAGLTVRVFGGTDTGVKDEHHVVVKVNGAVVGGFRFSGIGSRTFTLPFNPGFLVEGENTINVRNNLGEGVPYSIIHVDAFDLTYPRRLVAVNDRVEFDAEGEVPHTVSGFTTDDIHLLDISRPGRPVFVSDARIEADGATWRATFVPLSAAGRYVAFARGGVRSPAGVSAVAPTTLTASDNRADYVIVTLEGWMTAAQELADYRQGQGLETMVVDIEEVYTAFNHGLAGPHAIKRFMQHATANWDLGPRYLLLIGDGTYDYKDYLRNGDNLIPPQMVKTPYGLFSSDMVFGDTTGDDYVPEVAVGRISAMTEAEVSAAVNKIRQYETASNPGSWVDQTLLVADNPDNGGNFDADSDALRRDAIPAKHVVDRVYLGDLTLTDARARLLAGIDSGAKLVNYVGHGGLTTMANEGLLTSADVAGLNNPDKLPMMTAMTCIIGRFSVPGFDSVGEDLVNRSNGGAIAVWAPTGLSLNHNATRLNRAFVGYLFSEDEPVLGDGVRQAMQLYSTSEHGSFMLQIYTILGDPALKLK
ncbi:MAG: C25 family cysteine peptidase, partial [Verrucomicrobiota bacterium]